MVQLIEQKSTFLEDLALEHIIQALKEKDRVTRKSAAEALGKIGKPVVMPLIKALKDKQ